MMSFIKAYVDDRYGELYRLYSTYTMSNQRRYEELKAELDAIKAHLNIDVEHQPAKLVVKNKLEIA